MEEEIKKIATSIQKEFEIEMKLIYTKKEVNKMNNYLQKLNINENLKKEINS